jgi:hypothetical protein
LLTGWLREVCVKYDKFYQRGEFALRKLGGVLSFYFLPCIEKVMGVLSFSLLFQLSFAAFLPILGFCGSLILDDHF